MKTTIFAFVVAFLIFGAIPVAAQKEINKTFDGITKIRLSTASGSCKITKSDSKSVALNLQHTYDEDEYQPRIEQEGDRLTIKEDFRGNNHSGSAYWTLKVPEGVAITFSTGSGDLDITGVKTELRANSGSGNLTFIDTQGDVDATTGSGDLEIENFNGELNANTGSGTVTVANGQGDISLNCGSGNIRVSDVVAVLSANTGSGNIQGRNIKLNGSSKFNTGSGSARIQLAATPTFDVSINSGSGDAELDFNGNEIVGEIVMRASKRNGRITAPFEFDKTEETNEWGDNVTIKKTAVRGKGTNRISIGTGSGDAVIKK